MEKNSTLKFLSDFKQTEEKNPQSLGLNFRKEKPQPSEFTLKNILNYSKALSIRKTKILGFVEFVVN